MLTTVNPSVVFQNAIADHLAVIQALSGQQATLERIASEMTRAIFDGKKVLWCGNGGSAADSQHLAAELMGRFRRERRGLPSIALTTDTSILTAIGNDYGYEKVFRAPGGRPMRQRRRVGGHLDFRKQPKCLCRA